MSEPSLITQQLIPDGMEQRSKDLRRAMTSAEARLWARLRSGRLAGFHFRRQQIIQPFIVDFYCHRAALVVEIDGGIHLARKAYDALRDEHLQARGLRVLRFSNSQVNQQIDRVLEEILRACQDKTAPAEVV